MIDVVIGHAVDIRNNMNTFTEKVMNFRKRENLTYFDRKVMILTAISSDVSVSVPKAGQIIMDKSKSTTHLVGGLRLTPPSTIIRGFFDNIVDIEVEINIETLNTNVAVVDNTSVFEVLVNDVIIKNMTSLQTVYVVLPSKKQLSIRSVTPIIIRSAVLTLTYTPLKLSLTIINDPRNFTYGQDIENIIQQKYTASLTEPRLISQ